MKKLWLLTLSALALSGCNFVPLASSSLDSSSLSSSVSSSAITSSSVSSSSSSSSSSSASSTSEVSYESWEVEEGASLSITAMEMAGQYGDGTFISYKRADGTSYDILVDAGPSENSAYLPSFLKEKVTDKVLDLLVLSHQHADHYGGFYYNSLRNSGLARIEMIVDNGVSGYNSTYRSVWEEGIVAYYVAQGATYKNVQTLVEEGGEIKLSDYASLYFLDTGYYPEVGSVGNTSNPNMDSIAMCLRASNKAVFMAGDLAVGECESSLMALNSNEYGDPYFLEGVDELIVKTNHHSAQSHGGNSASYISWLAPDYVWTSSGITDENTGPNSMSIQHPYHSVVNRYIQGIYGSHYQEGLTLMEAGKRFFYNGTTGHLTFSYSDLGGDISISGAGRAYRDYYDRDGVFVPRSREKDLPYIETEFYQRQRSAQ